MNNFDSKYADFLTVILIIVIIAILGLGGYFGYTIYKGKKVEDDAQSALNEFNKKTPTKNTTNTNTTNETPDVSLDDILNDLNTTDDNSSQSSSSGSSSREKVYLSGYEVMGSIKIPKTKIEYPILSRVTPASLEASVAILYGVGLNQPGNTTILGHNLRNGKFFSNNDKLSDGDKIIIKDNEGTSITYTIYEMFYTDPNDADYMLRDTEGYREISLSTCNDDSSERLVILARES